MIPIINAFYICDLGNIKYTGGFTLLIAIPIIYSINYAAGLIAANMFGVWLFYGICKNLNKPRWLSLLNGDTHIKSFCAMVNCMGLLEK
ncbi:MAG: hypothetical protein GWP09_01175 [Nitrospiraceae bacterium]|nr:hypothetical protein [Nitrospiraceae bacterium]